MSRQKRPTREYLDSAKRLSKLVPSLRKYSRRKTLKPAEKSAIARREKQLRFADHLIPVTKKQARELKGQLFAPGIHAIQLRNTGTDVRIKKVKRSSKDLIVVSNGRTWIYWKLDRATVTNKRGMEKAAQEAFDMQFPVEKIAELATQAFDELRPYAVYLWAPSGRVGEGFQTIKQFLQWLYENWNAGRYTHQEKWVNGLAILLNTDGVDEYDDEDE